MSRTSISRQRPSTTGEDSQADRPDKAQSSPDKAAIEGRGESLTDLISRTLDFLIERAVAPINFQLGCTPTANLTQQRVLRNLDDCAATLESADDPVGRFLEGLTCIFPARTTAWKVRSETAQLTDEFRGLLCASLNELVGQISQGLENHFRGEREIYLSQEAGERFLEGFLGPSFAKALNLDIQRVPCKDKCTYRFVTKPMADIHRLRLDLARAERLLAEALEREEGTVESAQARERALARELDDSRKQASEALERCHELEQTILALRKDLARRVTARGANGDREPPEIAKETVGLFEKIPLFPGGRGNNPFQHLRTHYGKWLKAFGGKENSISQAMVRKYDPKLIKAAEQKISHDKKRKGSCTVDFGNGIVAPVEFLKDLVPTERFATTKRILRRQAASRPTPSKAMTG